MGQSNPRYIPGEEEAEWPHRNDTLFFSFGKEGKCRTPARTDKSDLIPRILGAQKSPFSPSLRSPSQLCLKITTKDMLLLLYDDD